jgi:hypothetical protein
VFEKLAGICPPIDGSLAPFSRVFPRAVPADVHEVAPGARGTTKTRKFFSLGLLFGVSHSLLRARGVPRPPARAGSSASRTLSPVAAGDLAGLGFLAKMTKSRLQAILSWVLSLREAPPPRSSVDNGRFLEDEFEPASPIGAGCFDVEGEDHV